MKNIIFFFFLILFCIPFKESNQDPTTKEGFIKRYLLYLSKYSGSGGGPIFTPAIGELDTTFGGTGIVTTNIGSTNPDNGQAIAIQSDGKIVVAGSSFNGTDDDFAVVRYNTDGSLDTTFGGTGIVTTDIGYSKPDNGQAIAIQSDGKIVVAGSSFNGTDDDFAVVRYNTNGSLDTSFDTDGKVTTDINTGFFDNGQAIAIQSDGNIVVAGYSYNGANNDFAVVRYKTNGSLDTSFDTDGKVTTDIGNNVDNGQAVAIQSDGNIVVAGYSYNGSNNDFAVVRYKTNGSLDTSFDTDGKVTTDIGNNVDNGQAVAIQSDGKIVVVGYSYNGTNNDFAVVRYNTDGSLDTSFDSDGKVTIDIGNDADYGQAVAIQSDGKIVVAGYSINGTYNDFAVVRYNTDGSLDTSFDSDGKVTTNFGTTDGYGQAIVIQNDGKIVVAGYSDDGSNPDFAVVRYK